MVEPSQKNDGDNNYTRLINGQPGNNYRVENESGIDYLKLIEQFGCTYISSETNEKLAELTGGEPHRFLRRNIFFCERDLGSILKKYENKTPFYLYTGRGPSAEAMHLGHAVPMIFTAWLQKAFDVPCVIQITDDEKFVFRAGDSLETIQKNAIGNIKDIIAFGFDPEKTFIFMDTEYMGKEFYTNIIHFQKHVNFSQLKGIFGFDEQSNAGMIAYPAIQAAPSRSSCFPHIFTDPKCEVPCLIPAAVDQDPFFRMTRDVCQKLKWQKPASIYSVFFPALKGLEEKMGGANVDSCILLTDTPQMVSDKINKYAKSGGGATLEEHRSKGADLNVDIPYQWLRFFLEDDEELLRIGTSYKKGEMTTGEIKAILIKVIQQFLADFQTRRVSVSDEEVAHFMKVRPLKTVPKAFE